MSESMKISSALSNKMANMALLCAFLIVTLHVSYYGGGMTSWVFTGRGIGNIAVPYFFIASGFFAAGHMQGKLRNWWICENKKRVFSLVIPYLFWNVFYWLFMKGLSVLAAKFGVSFGESLPSGLSLGLNPFELPQLPYLWFVRCLIVFVAFLPLFLVFKRKILGVFCISFLFVLLLVAPEFLPKTVDWHENFVRVVWLRGVFWFSIGIFLRWNPVPLPVLNRWWQLVTLGLSVLPWAGLAMMSNASEDPIVNSIAKYIAIALSLIFVWMIVPKFQLPKMFTSCAFPVFLLHSAVMTILIGVYKFCGIKELADRSASMYFLSVILIVGVSVMLAIGIKKIDWLAKLAFGGR